MPTFETEPAAEDAFDPILANATEAEEEEEEVEQAQIHLKRKPGRPKKADAPLRQLTVERDTALVDFLASLGSGNDTLKIMVDRKSPKTWTDNHGNVHQIEGRVDTFEEPISEEDIKERHGGGTYALAVQVKNERGKWTFIPGGHRTIKISGEPILKGIIADRGPSSAPKEEVGAVKIAMDAMQRVMDRNDSRSADPMMETLLRNMQNDMAELRRSAAEKDERIFALVTKRPEESTADRLLERMMMNESSRIEALRVQHESELRVTRERLQADADRQFGVLQNQIASAEKQSERELDNLKRSYEAQIEQMKLAHLGQVQGFQREMRHLDTLLEEAKTELTVLRAQKQLTPMDMVKQVSELKEVVSMLGGGESSEEEASSPLERIVGGILNSPLAQGIAQRVAEGPGSPAYAAQAQAQGQAPMTIETMPVNQPVRVGDKVLVKREDGSLNEIQRKKKPTVEVKGGQKVVLNPTELKDMIRFMESAVGKQEPAVFAASVRNMIPQDIQKAFAADAQGVDHFLDEVANLDPASSLSTQAGRTWLREVAKHVFV